MKGADVSGDVCPNCGEPIVEGRMNCGKCGATYPDAEERELTWDPSQEEEENS